MSNYSQDELEKFMLAAIKDGTGSFGLFLASRGHAGKKLDRYTMLQEFVVYTDSQWALLGIEEDKDYEVAPL
jgi:hypothetical protein